MKEIIISIFMIIILLLGLPLLIVFMKDRGGISGLIIKRVFGLISLVFGLGIIGWVIFNIFHPMQEFKGSFISIFQLATPIALVAVGWNWLISTEKNNK